MTSASARSAILLLGLSGVLCSPAGAASPEATTPIEQAVALYEQGELPQARARFEALARAGEPAAMHNLAVMNLRGEVPGASAQAALGWLQKAADKGFVTAQFALGELYESGRLGRPDLAAALRWYSRAAEAGSAEGQVAVATAYFMGRGPRADTAQAAL
eukprot:gene45977-61465_t